MKRVFSLMLALAMAVVLAVPVLAAKEGVPHVVDNAKLLTADQRRSLENRAASLSRRYQFDFVIVTVGTIGNASAQAYADDYFDYNGYGYGERFDGILLLVSMAQRDWSVSTCGYGEEAFTAYGLEYLMDRVLPPMSDSDYAGAFGTFLSQAEDLLKQARAGKPLDVPERFEGFPGVSLVICAALGFGFAFVPVNALKKQVRNVERRLDAMDYAADGGLELSRRTDRFLYSSVSKTPRPKETSSSSSGGSTSHTSSSGRSHGGASGKF